MSMNYFSRVQDEDVEASSKFFCLRSFVIIVIDAE